MGVSPLSSLVYQSSRTNFSVKRSCYSVSAALRILAASPRRCSFSGLPLVNTFPVVVVFSLFFPCLQLIAPSSSSSCSSHAFVLYVECGGVTTPSNCVFPYIIICKNRSTPRRGFCTSCSVYGVVGHDDGSRLLPSSLIDRTTNASSVRQ